MVLSAAMFATCCSIKKPCRVSLYLLEGNVMDVPAVKYDRQWGGANCLPPVLQAAQACMEEPRDRPARSGAQSECCASRCCQRALGMSPTVASSVTAFRVGAATPRYTSSSSGGARTLLRSTCAHRHLCTCMSRCASTCSATPTTGAVVPSESHAASSLSSIGQGRRGAAAFMSMLAAGQLPQHLALHT